MYLSSLIECCRQSDSGVHVQESLHGHFLAFLVLVQPHLKRWLVALFQVLVKENVHSNAVVHSGQPLLEQHTPERYHTVSPPSIFPQIQLHFLSREIKSRLNGLMFHSKFEQFSTVDTPLLNKICKNKRLIVTF